MIGSRADRIVHLAPCPVLVVKQWGQYLMFSKILHANDGSEHAFNALSLALKIAKQSAAELHMVSVEEIDYLPESMEDVRQETGAAARRFHTVVNRSRAMAEECQVTLKTHVIAGHPVRD